MRKGLIFLLLAIILNHASPVTIGQANTFRHDGASDLVTLDVCNSGSLQGSDGISIPALIEQPMDVVRLCCTGRISPDVSCCCISPFPITTERPPNLQS